MSMLSKEDILGELQLKSLCVDYILEKADDTNNFVVINELNFRDNKRRADLVEVNGYSHAYEIKSDRDSLTKLYDQIQDYKVSFDKVTVVTTHKHLKKVLEICPDKVGVLVESNQSLYPARKARLYKRFSKFTLASFITQLRINKELSEANINYKHLTLTDKRLTLSQIKSQDELYDLALYDLKEQYQDSFGRFLGSHKKQKHIKNIEILKTSHNTLQLCC